MTNNAKYKQKTDLGTKKMDMVYVRYCGAEDDFKFKKTPEECLKKVKPKRTGQKYNFENSGEHRSSQVRMGRWR